LALAVFALFILGMLSSTAFLLSFGEHQVGRKFVRYQQAAAAADAGAFSALERWDAQTYNRLAVGGAATFDGNLADGTGAYAGSVTRIGARLFLVTAEGTSADAEVRQRAGTIMRLQPLQISTAAALGIGGPLHIEQAVRIDGFDRSPPSWNCPPAIGPVPALQAPTAGIDGPPWSGCAPTLCLEGIPRWQRDTVGNGTGSLDLGVVTLADLRAVAVHVMDGGNVNPHPVESNGICVTADTYNWGNPFEPLGGCGDHFPAVYSEGDLNVHSGFGQGILVVEGDLTVSGGFHYFGVVIVLGSFRSVGVGSQITGAVMVANRDFEPQSLDGMTRIQYSNCAVSRALAASGRGVLLRERSWLDWY